MSKKRLWIYRFSSISVGIFIALLIGEFALRFLQPQVTSDIDNPKERHVSNKKNILIKNLVNGVAFNAKLDSVIYRSVNNIDLRGPDLPTNSDSLFKIFAVGGSTTICEYLTDGKDWPNIVGSDLNKKTPVYG